MLSKPSHTKRVVLIGRWRLATPTTAVWHVVRDLDRWPNWWPCIVSVQPAPDGSQREHGHGRRRVRLIWRNTVGLRRTLDLQVIRCERSEEGCYEAEAISENKREQRALWLLDPVSPRGTDLTLRWETELTAPWPAPLHSIEQVLLAGEYFRVMRSSADGMARHLGCALSAMSTWSSCSA